MSAMIELRKSVPVVADVDVLIVGAGIAGATAAVTAARNGVRTMLVDRFGYPGGNMGPGMIGGAPNLELPASMSEGLPGIPGEFVKRCEQYCNAPLLAHYFRDSQVISYVWNQMLQEASVQLMYNTYAADPIMEGKQVAGLFVENKNGTQAIRAQVVVDATGDADVAARAGAPTDGGKSLFHAGTYFAMANVDVDRYLNRVPGFEKAYLHIIAPYFNSRGGRSIISDYPVTMEDVEQGRKFDDVVLRACRKLLGLNPVRYKTTYEFPYRQFLPRKVDGLLVTGRACIIQPPVMRIRWMVLLMGQAAGAAAALAVKAATIPRKLKVKELQSLLYHQYQAPLGDQKRLSLDIDGGCHLSINKSATKFRKLIRIHLLQRT